MKGTMRLGKAPRELMRPRVSGFLSVGNCSNHWVVRGRPTSESHLWHGLKSTKQGAVKASVHCAEGTSRYPKYVAAEARVTPPSAPLARSCGGCHWLPGGTHCGAVLLSIPLYCDGIDCVVSCSVGVAWLFSLPRPLSYVLGRGLRSDRLLSTDKDAGAPSVAPFSCTRISAGRISKSSLQTRCQNSGSRMLGELWFGGRGFSTLAV